MSTTTLLECVHSNNRKWWTKILDLKEAEKQFFLAIPMIITNASYYCVTLISVMFAGHLGEQELAGATLANSWATVTGLALMTGLSGSLETLCGQAFGAKLYWMLGIYLQSSIIISIFFSSLVCVIWLYSETILILLHQKPDVSKMTALYLKYLIPGLFSYGFLQCTIRYLQTQTTVTALVIFSVLPLVIQVGVAYILVHHTSLGFKGAPVAASTSLWMSFFMLVFYIKYSSRFEQTWKGFSMECFKYVLPNMKLALPSAFMVCLELWAFELLVLIAGLMPDSEYSTSLIAICVNTEAVTFMIAVGFSAAVSTRVSNELGAGNIDQAKNAIKVTLKLCVLLVTAVLLFLVFGHNLWVHAFSDSSFIKEGFSSMTPLLALSILLDSVQGVLSGVARACGWQHLGAWTNLGAFYLIGMPISILLAFKLALYAHGLWIGLICGISCQALILIVITVLIDWSNLQLSVGELTDSCGH